MTDGDAARARRRRRTWRMHAAGLLGWGVLVALVAVLGPDDEVGAPIGVGVLLIPVLLAGVPWSLLVLVGAFDVGDGPGWVGSVFGALEHAGPVAYVGFIASCAVLNVIIHGATHLRWCARHRQPRRL